MKIASTFHNAVAVPEKVFDYPTCEHCVFFDKSTLRSLKECTFKYERLGSCMYHFDSSHLSLIFIPQESRTI